MTHIQLWFWASLSLVSFLTPPRARFPCRAGGLGQGGWVSSHRQMTHGGPSPWWGVGASQVWNVASSPGPPGPGWQGCLAAHCLRSQFFTTCTTTPLHWMNSLCFTSLKWVDPFLNSEWHPIPFWISPLCPTYSRGIFWMADLEAGSHCSHSKPHIPSISNNTKENSALSCLYSRCGCIQKPKSSGCIFKPLTHHSSSTRTAGITAIVLRRGGASWSTECWTNNGISESSNLTKT